MSRNTEYLARMETQLRKWDADVDALSAARKKAGAIARGAYYEQMKTLRASRILAHRTFQQMRAADPVDALMYAHMQAAWEAMREALDDMAGKPGT